MVETNEEGVILLSRYISNLKGFLKSKEEVANSVRIGEDDVQEN